MVCCALLSHAELRAAHSPDSDNSTIQTQSTYESASGLHMMRLMISTAALTPLPVKSVSMCPSPPGLWVKERDRKRGREGMKGIRGSN